MGRTLGKFEEKEFDVDEQRAVCQGFLTTCSHTPVRKFSSH